MADLLGIVPIMWSSCKASSEILNLSFIAITCWMVLRSFAFLYFHFPKSNFNQMFEEKTRKFDHCQIRTKLWKTIHPCEYMKQRL
jgi:hypothetical protein